MGMFTSAIEPGTGHVVQFKNGHDECATFRVGETIPWTPGFVPDIGIDGIYQGWWEDAPDDQSGPHYWVVVCDSKLADVVRNTASYESLESRFTFTKPDPALWSLERRDNYRLFKEKHDRSWTVFEDSTRGLGELARLIAAVAWGHRPVDYAAIGRKAFIVQDLPDPPYLEIYEKKENNH